MMCVVCGGAINEPRFANAWEKSRKLYPCCSSACADRFDPDVHWLPASAPPPASGMDEAKLLGVAKQRLKSGDPPTVVVRDLLVSGVGLPGARKLLIDAGLAARRSEREADKLFILRLIARLLGGGLWFRERRDKRDPAALIAAEAELGVWADRFGAP